MKALRQQLLDEKQRLMDIIVQTERELSNLPEGFLRISNSNNRIRYYYRQAFHDVDEKYITKTNLNLAKDLAQQSYDKKIIKCAKQQLSIINRFLDKYFQNDIEQVYLDENEARRALIQPVELTWEAVLTKWADEKYEGKLLKENTPVFLTDRGERVRSKSEKILSDYFYHHNIPYKYEHPLYLKGI